MADDQFDVCSKALGLMGEEPITSFEDDTAQSEQCGLHYEMFIRSLMMAKDWYFLRKRADLVEDGAAVPVNEWTRAFLLPSDALGPPVAMDRTWRGSFRHRPAQARWSRGGKSQAVTF